MTVEFRTYEGRPVMNLSLVLDEGSELDRTGVERPVEVSFGYWKAKMIGPELSELQIFANDPSKRFEVFRLGVASGRPWVVTHGQAVVLVAHVKEIQEFVDHTKGGK